MFLIGSLSGVVPYVIVATVYVVMMFANIGTATRTAEPHATQRTETSQSIGRTLTACEPAARAERHAKPAAPAAHRHAHARTAPAPLAAPPCTHSGHFRALFSRPPPSL